MKRITDPDFLVLPGKEADMILTGACVFGENGRFARRDLVIRNGRFCEDTPENRAGDTDVVSVEGCCAIPGLVDLHFHGAMGCDVCDATEEAYQTIADYEASHGITTICPALLTLPAATLEKALSVGAAFARSSHSGADLVGFNMEGPFISPVKKGAQNEQYILQADADLTYQFIRASGGLLKIIGLAPEENPGFEDYIGAVKDRVTVSLAHTNADYDTAMKAFAAGASHAVHLYNAMTELSHRAPGVVGAVADSPWVNAEIICDGIHVHPAAVRAAFRMIGADRMILISDSLRATGMPDGEYELGGETVVKKGGYCTLKEDGNLAGSVSNLMDCMKNAVKTMGIPLETAVASATINPARAIHCEDSCGVIAPGRKADLVLLSADEALTTRMVIKS